MKKTRLLMLIYAAMQAVICVGQQDLKIDSLLTILTTQKDDSTKVNTLIALSRQYLQAKNISAAKKNAEDAFQLAKKTQYKKGITNAYNNEGNIYNQLGNLFYSQSNYPEALTNYLASLRLFEKGGAQRAIAYAYTRIGQVYWTQLNYSEALKNYLKALEIFEEIKDKNGLAAIYNNIGIVYENQGYYPEALKYYDEAIKMYVETGNKWAMIDRYFNIGFLYEDQQNYPEALKNHLTALKISEEIGTKEGIAASNSNIGGVYNNQGNYPEALKSYLLALKLYRESDNQAGIAISYNNIGGVYIDLKEFLHARQYLNDGLSLSKELGLIENIKVIYELLAKLDSATGNWQEAFTNHKLYIVYRDSLLNEENTGKIMKARMQYDFDKKEDSLKYRHALTDEQLKQQTLLTQQQQQAILLKEKEFALITNEKQLQELQIEKDRADFAAQKIAQKAYNDSKQGQLVLLNKEKSIQTLELNKQRQLKNYLLAGLALFVVLSYFVYRNYRTRQELKLQMLRNKIASDLHDDVGSTLSSISIFSQVAQQQSKEVIPMLETIGESSRKMLDAMADIVWTINPENDQFEKIILRMRSFAYELLGAKQIDFEFVATDDVTQMKLPMNVRKNLYLIFKEATNNMVKYSVADRALFSLTAQKTNLTMLITDNGKGFDTNIITNGNGLKNMKKRAIEIGAKLVISSLPGTGTTIELDLEI